MVERAVAVLTMSEVGDGQVGQRHEAADLDTVDGWSKNMQHSKRYEALSTRSDRCSQCRVTRAYITKSKHQTSCRVEDGLGGVAADKSEA